jgi:hypothetical protein
MAGKRNIGTQDQLRRRVRALREEFRKVHARGMKAHRLGYSTPAYKAALRESVLIGDLVSLIERTLRSRHAPESSL